MLGYNRFYKIGLLEKEGYILSSVDTLVLNYYVRPPTYSQKCRDQSNYITQLEAAIHKNKSMIIEENEVSVDIANDNESPVTPVRSPESKDSNDPKEEDVESSQ